VEARHLRQTVYNLQETSFGINDNSEKSIGSFFSFGFEKPIVMQELEINVRHFFQNDQIALHVRFPVEEIIIPMFKKIQQSNVFFFLVNVPVFQNGFSVGQKQQHFTPSQRFA
jgi:hypothetical protein